MALGCGGGVVMLMRSFWAVDLDALLNVHWVFVTS